jgi:hypothetical protein
MSFVRAAGVVVLCVCATSVIYGEQAANAPQSSQAAASAGQQNRQANYKLADEFLKWYESQYVKGMQEVDGSTTDVGDLVKEIGLDATVERFAGRRRPNLEYAMKHPADEKIPDSEIERIARKQMEEVVANARTSKKYISYDKPKLQEGVTESYRQRARLWIPFYRKLLAAPAPSSGMSFKEFVKASIPREEYAKMMDRMASGIATFYNGLRAGVSWYSPTGPWVRSKLDKSARQDAGITKGTVDEIYGKLK